VSIRVYKVGVDHPWFSGICTTAITAAAASAAATIVATAATAAAPTSSCIAIAKQSEQHVTPKHAT
jgi:hypothetical protein